MLWSLIAGIAPAVSTGQVRLCVVDPKGGMELGAGAPMFTVFTHDATDTTLHLLRQLVEVMRARANRLRGKTRLHTPTPSEPLFVVVIDEIAALTAYVTDRKVRSEIEQLLGLLLSQGRAVGISVVAAVQDPAKDTLPVRQLFTVRIGLRLTEATQTTMVLGQGARDAGADCDHIPDTTPGVGYMMIDGTAQPVRVRAFHVTDHDITTLARTIPATAGRDPHQPVQRRAALTPTGVNGDYCNDSPHAGVTRDPRHNRHHSGGGSDGAPRVLDGVRIVVAARGIRWLLRPPHPTHGYRRVWPGSGGVDTVQQPPRAGVPVVLRPVCPRYLAARARRDGRRAPRNPRHHRQPPQVFLTLTAPSYGPVHTTARAGEKTPGVPRPPPHLADTSAVRMENRCGAVTPTMRATASGAAALRRTATTTSGMCYSPGTYLNSGDASPSPCAATSAPELRATRADPEAVRVSFIKVVELQARAVPHIHALIRLDPARRRRVQAVMDWQRPGHGNRLATIIQRPPEPWP